MKEFLSSIGEPYYAIPKSENKELYSKYMKEAEANKKVYFLGRLGTYSYMNMDAVVYQTLEFCKYI